MATDAFKNQFRLNEETIAGFAGLGFKPVKKVVTCQTCEDDDGHSCIICGYEITTSGCKDRGGYCIDCYNDYINESR